MLKGFDFLKHKWHDGSMIEDTPLSDGGVSVDKAFADAKKLFEQTRKPAPVIEKVPLTTKQRALRTGSVILAIAAPIGVGAGVSAATTHEVGSSIVQLQPGEGLAQAIERDNAESHALKVDPANVPDFMSLAQDAASRSLALNNETVGQVGDAFKVSESQDVFGNTSIDIQAQKMARGQLKSK